MCKIVQIFQHHGASGIGGSWPILFNMEIVRIYSKLGTLFSDKRNLFSCQKHSHEITKHCGTVHRWRVFMMSPKEWTPKKNSGISGIDDINLWPSLTLIPTEWDKMANSSSLSYASMLNRNVTCLVRCRLNHVTRVLFQQDDVPWWNSTRTYVGPWILYRTWQTSPSHTKPAANCWIIYVVFLCFTIATSYRWSMLV